MPFTGGMTSPISMSTPNEGFLQALQAAQIMRMESDLSPVAGQLTNNLQAQSRSPLNSAPPAPAGMMAALNAMPGLVKAPGHGQLGQAAPPQVSQGVPMGQGGYPGNYGYAALQAMNQPFRPQGV